jgi:hypothetical protein
LAAGCLGLHERNFRIVIADSALRTVCRFRFKNTKNRVSYINRGQDTDRTGCYCKPRGIDSKVYRCKPRGTDSQAVGF